MAAYWSRWKRTTDAIQWARGCTALPECCACRRPAEETQVSFYRIRSGTPIDEIPYYSPSPKFRCSPDEGCNREPWSRRGADLRMEMATWDNGQGAFVRKSDGARLVIAE